MAKTGSVTICLPQHKAGNPRVVLFVACSAHVLQLQEGAGEMRSITTGARRQESSPKEGPQNKK